MDIPGLLLRMLAIALASAAIAGILSPALVVLLNANLAGAVIIAVTVAGGVGVLSTLAFAYWMVRGL